MERLFTYPHEFTHLIVAKLCGFKVVEVCYYRKPTTDDNQQGYVTFEISDNLSKIEALKVALVMIAPLTLTFLLLFFLYSCYPTGQLTTYKIVHNFIMFSTPVLCLKGFAPSKDDFKDFFEMMQIVFK